MVEQLKQKSLVEMLGEAEAAGRAAGHAAGRLEAARHWLKRDIEERFGPLSPELAARIDASGDEAALEAIRARLKGASSIEHVLMEENA